MIGGGKLPLPISRGQKNEFVNAPSRRQAAAPVFAGFASLRYALCTDQNCTLAVVTVFTRTQKYRIEVTFSANTAPAAEKRICKCTLAAASCRSRVRGVRFTSLRSVYGSKLHPRGCYCLHADTEVSHRSDFQREQRFRGCWGDFFAKVPLTINLYSICKVVRK